MLTYGEPKHKHKSLLAMTNLKHSESEDLLVHCSAAWEGATGTDLSKGERPPVITAMAELGK